MVALKKADLTATPDGKPLVLLYARFTAKDAAFNMMRIAGKLDPDRKALFQRASLLGGMDKAEAVDDKTVKVSFTTPNSGFTPFDAAIASAQHTLWDRMRIVAEPAGATALAALLSGSYVPAPDERIAIVISGGNSDAVSFAATSVDERQHQLAR